MAPKQVPKKGYNQKDDGSDVEETRDDEARGSNDPLPEDASMEEVIALVKKMSLTTLEAEETKYKKQAKELIEKMKVISTERRLVQRDLKKEETAEKKKEAYEKMKSDKASLRGEMKTFTVNLGSLSVEVRVRLSTTIGALRKAIGSVLNLSSKTTARLLLNLDGVVLTSHPRKTLLGFHVRQGGTINANIAGMEGYTPFNEDDINAIFKNNDDDDAKTSEEENSTNDEEPDDV